MNNHNDYGSNHLTSPVTRARNKKLRKADGSRNGPYQNGHQHQPSDSYFGQSSSSKLSVQDEEDELISGLKPKSGQLPKQSPLIASSEMCYFCFDVLFAHLYNKPAPMRPSFTNNGNSYPIFVTWKIGAEKRLRGCIGTFNAIPLHVGLRDYALSSALRDGRFKPITKDEFNRLHVCVSLLLNFEPGADYRDWTIGVHGIRIEFRNENGSKRTATYLPEVAAEQNWNHLQTIDSLLRKGGYRGPITDQVRQDIQLTRYTSEKVSVSYQEYYNFWLNQSASGDHQQAVSLKHGY